MSFTPIARWYAFPSAKSATEGIRIFEAEQVCGFVQLQDWVGQVIPRHVVSGRLLHLRPSEFRRQLEANMIGPMMVTQAFAPLLGTNNKRTGPVGRIVNISTTRCDVERARHEDVGD
jgi:NAD(P)-dependent dehydrogenase (short-subunit alcohol dehydrogenase family)